MVVQGGGTLGIGDEDGQVAVEYLFTPDDDNEARVTYSASTWNDPTGYTDFLSYLDTVIRVGAPTSSALTVAPYTALRGMWHEPEQFPPTSNEDRIVVADAGEPAPSQ